MRFPAAPVLAVLVLGQTALAQNPMQRPQRPGRGGTPTAVSPGGVAVPQPAPGVAKVQD